MPVLFFFRALRLFLTENDQLVGVEADVDIFLVHAGKFSRHFEGVISFRYADGRHARPDPGRRRFLVESTKYIFHFAPHEPERVQFLARGPQSRKVHLLSPCLEKLSKNILALPTLAALIWLKTANLSARRARASR